MSNVYSSHQNRLFLRDRTAKNIKLLADTRNELTALRSTARDEFLARIHVQVEHAESYIETMKAQEARIVREMNASLKAIEPAIKEADTRGEQSAWAYLVTLAANIYLAIHAEGSK